ncbi:hypothetical protein KFU94_04885, partial [Chloroflexi bacterium TSY]|nr:hypothetical protein [Chloroflexi bacterium TSY]
MQPRTYAFFILLFSSFVLAGCPPVNLVITPDASMTETIPITQTAVAQQTQVVEISNLISKNKDEKVQAQATQNALGNYIRLNQKNNYTRTREWRGG